MAILSTGWGAASAGCQKPSFDDRLAGLGLGPLYCGRHVPWRVPEGVAAFVEDLDPLASPAGRAAPYGVWGGAVGRAG